MQGGFLREVDTGALVVSGAAVAFDVTDARFGATGDGVTDDTDAVVAADAAAAEVGGTVVFPPGQYVISSLLPSSGVSYVGYGATLIHKTGTVNPMFYRPPATTGTLENVTFRDLIFEGEESPASPSAQIAVYLRGGTIKNVRIIDCTASNFASAGFYISEAVDVQIRGCLVYNCATILAGRNAINVYAQSGTDAATFGGIILANNIVDTTNNGGITLVTIGAGFYSKGVITGNVVKNATNWAGIACETNTSGHQISITGNTLIGCLIGIQSANTGGTSPQPADTRSIVISGNVIDADTATGSTGKGMQITSSWTVVTGNSIRYPATGISMGGVDSTHRASGQLIANNALASFNVSGTGQFAMTGSYMDDCSISGNRCTIESGAISRGLNFADTTALHITGNHIAGGNRDGILLSGGTADATVEGNVIFDPNTGASTYSGITVTGAVTGTLAIRNNRCIDRRTGSLLMKYGIDISGVTGTATISLVDNELLGWVTAAVTGTATIKARNIIDTTGWLEPWSVIGVGSAPAFENSWSNTGGSDMTARYRKTSEGMVIVEGQVSHAAFSAGSFPVSTIFTLPAGYRPAARIRRAPTGFASGTTFSQTQVYINSDGTIQLGFTSQALTQMHLGFSFQAEA